ncbi:TIGR01244 family sulfur transferase [Brevundimonas sp. 2R-24]|uniref:TIGR01244 family sulfur transferase n=1 Tax=Peiella sedimenti TaxID=3061083 RepID=A0ABT8SM93_9CAUL|nr:TIGR01244 family sulfur transferase [Caulobacteraceae bacterium XZ-24]
MADIRRITDHFWAAPQLSPSDLAEIARQGAVLIINNRPEGESPDQPPGAEIEEAARAAGLDYAAVPITGRPTPDQVQAVAVLLEGAEGPVLGFCRTGTRSTMAWAGVQIAAGRHRDAVLAEAAQCGYDLSAVL